MNSTELMAVRVRNSKRRTDIAQILGLKYDAYSRKERGMSNFTPRQIVLITKELGLTYEQVNDIFFDGELPQCKSEKAVR